LYGKYFLKSNSAHNVVKVYSNPDTCKVRILAENKSKTGIYRWVNTINGKSYKGSALNLRHRFISYFNINQVLHKRNMLICRALVKSGYSSFNLEILEYCEGNTRIVRQIYNINLYKPEYNVIKLCNSMRHRSGYVHKNSSKLKIASNKPKRRMVKFKAITTNTEQSFDFFLFNR